jgi:hypothetical protein
MRRAHMTTAPGAWGIEWTGGNMSPISSSGSPHFARISCLVMARVDKSEKAARGSRKGFVSKSNSRTKMWVSLRGEGGSTRRPKLVRLPMRSLEGSAAL